MSAAATRRLADSIPKCMKAMQTVYGPFAQLSPAQASSWIPPPMAEGHRGRYLWTDAFGVLNLITLGTLAHNPTYTTLAARLIARVHDVLGRTRDGTRRLPGATDAHPLRGGLRIGKASDEDDPSGDGDGQYHHYLTLWMFALNRMSLAARDPRYNALAVELAQAVHPRFVRDRDAERPRMCWKMSVDLSRPVVRSEGNLDPINGYVVYTLLQRTDKADPSVLAQEVREYRKILDTKWRQYVSDDPLDLGLTLWTAHWLDGEEEWATQLTNRAAICTRVLFEDGYYDQSRAYRLAFREFGTGLGMRCHTETRQKELSEEEQEDWEAYSEKILSTWEPDIERGSTHTPASLVPITLVMYSSAVIPGAFHRDFFEQH